jgi:hypothetical protein
MQVAKLPVADLDIYIYMVGQPQRLWHILQLHLAKCHVCCKLVQSNFRLPQLAYAESERSLDSTRYWLDLGASLAGYGLLEVATEGGSENGLNRLARIIKFVPARICR